MKTESTASLPRRLFVWFALVLIGVTVPWIAAAGAEQPTDLLHDDFEAGLGGWQADGRVMIDDRLARDRQSVRLQANGQIERLVPTAGHTDIRLSWTIAARSLESQEQLLVEVHAGAGWRTVSSIGNGQDDRRWYDGTAAITPSSPDDNSIRIRFRLTGSSVGDYGYVDDVNVVAYQGPSGGPPAERRSLSARYLQGDDARPQLFPDGDLSMPPGADQPRHQFEGRLVIQPMPGGGRLNVLRDDYGYADHPGRATIPAMDLRFVQVGRDLVPTERGNISTDHPTWTYIVGPGKSWSEPGDGGFSRASFPFALVQRNANCTHNGTMTFLYNDASVSRLHYQITQETCLYFKADLFGLVEATLIPESPSPATADAKRAFVAEVERRIPTRSIDALAIEHPDFDIGVFARGLTAEHVTTFGLVHDGIHYRGPVRTRHGTYPYPDNIRLPSYSTAKSFFAATTLMRLEQLEPGVSSRATIGRYLPEVAVSDRTWDDVTFENALDMATGHRRSTRYMADEASSVMERDFFLAETYQDRIAGALRWSRRDDPGSRWVYHSSDHFILGRAIQNYLESTGREPDIMDFYVSELLEPADIGPGAHTSLRTSDDDWDGQAMVGYGLWLAPDDVAKLANLVNHDHGSVGGEQLLDPSMLDAALQRDPNDRGLPTANQPFLYNNGFWSLDVRSERNNGCRASIPFASGFGGITVAMMPNGTSYYYFSDNDEFSWASVVAEVDTKIEPLCTSDQAAPSEDDPGSTDDHRSRRGRGRNGR